MNLCIAISGQDRELIKKAFVDIDKRFFILQKQTSVL
jgi:hypothetical protein